MSVRSVRFNIRIDISSKAGSVCGSRITFGDQNSIWQNNWWPDLTETTSETSSALWAMTIFQIWCWWSGKAVCSCTGLPPQLKSASRKALHRSKVHLTALHLSIVHLTTVRKSAEAQKCRAAMPCPLQNCIQQKCTPHLPPTPTSSMHLNWAAVQGAAMVQRGVH